MPEPRLRRFEEELTRVGGVRRVRVIGDDQPTEIHVVATFDRTPKQLVRDVQSLAAAAFGFTIDHRIVSVVQLDDQEPEEAVEGVDREETPPQESADIVTDEPDSALAQPKPIDPFAVLAEGHDAEEATDRLIIEHVVITSGSASGWIEVALRWPTGAITRGESPAGPTRDARSRSAVTATLRALEPVLSGRSATVEVEHIGIQRVGSDESVLVSAVFHEGGRATSVMGAAVVQDDVATAAVRSLLHAVNRKL